MKEVVDSYDYPVDISAALSDVDGSESLNMALTNIPENVTFDKAIDNGDGTWTLNIDPTETSLSETLTMNVPVDTPNFDLGVTTTATESSTGDTNSVTETINIAVENDETSQSDTSNEGITIDMDDGKSSKGEEVHGTENDDTINVGGKDFQAYGEAGDDVFNVDSDDMKHTSGSKGGEFDGKDSLIDGGEGLDGLVFSDDLNLDFDNLSDNISSIEQIDLGNGDQTITNLSVEDVLDMTDENDILRIDGEESDHINLDTTNDGKSGEWTLGNFQTTDEMTGETYDAYTNDDETVTFEINTNIHVDES
jgi:hypothetical protein